MNRSVKVLLVLLTVPLLTACFGGSSGETDDGTIQRHTFKNFTINTASSWRKISEENFANTIPNETVALFIRKIEGDDFIQNLNVVKESINTDASSLEYAKANILLGSKAIIDYRPINTEQTSIGELPTVLHTFRARNSSTDPLRFFAQSFFARDRVAYTVTCIAKDDDQAQQTACTEAVSSFRFL